MEKADINAYAKSDLYYIETIGDFVRYNRLNQNKTQEELAAAAGINRTTLSQMEKGKPVNLISLVQVLRALKKLDVFAMMETKPQLSPLQLAAIEQKQRQRAGRKKTDDGNKPKSDW